MSSGQSSMVGPPDDPGYMKHRGPIFSLSVAYIVLASVAVPLRYLAKWRARHRLDWDDLLMFFCLLCFYGEAGVCIWWSNSGGYGYPYTDIPMSLVTVQLKSSYMLALFYIPAITFAKLSVLFLYYRIFGHNRTFFWCMIGMVVASLLWGVGFFIAAIFRCIPVDAAWNLTLDQSRCYDFTTAVLVTEPINGVQDFIIVAMPLFIIRKLQLSRKKRISVGFVFLLGAFVGISSFVRIGITVNPSDPLAGLLQTAPWAITQLFVAVLCPCFLTYRGLIPNGDYLRHLRSFYSVVSFSHRSPGQSRRGRSASIPSLDPESIQFGKPGAGKTDVECRADFRNASENEDDAVPLGSIKVDNTVSVV